MKFKTIAIVAIFASLSGMAVFAGHSNVPASVEAAMNAAHRSDANQARNRYRHPVGTLIFFGLKADMSVLEIWPGSGWYSEILAPVLRDKGRFTIAGWDTAVEGQPDYRYRLQEMIEKTFADNPAVYDQVHIQGYSPPRSASLGDPNSYDLVLTFRNIHSWIGGDLAAPVFAEFARVLKPGGVLGVVQHRAIAGSDPKKSAELGYVPESGVIELARQAGLYLDGRSEVNGNTADLKNYPGGVWTLPPSLRACRQDDEAQRKDCNAPFLAIGESDRMTLRFRKPID